MRKKVAQPKPDLSVVRILRQGRRVVRTPVTNRAAFELERHFHGVASNLTQLRALRDKLRNIDLQVCAPSGVALPLKLGSGVQTRWAHRLQAYVPIL
jgi:hypothetical protein